MDYTKLDVLMAITKKKDASKDKKEEYAKNMLSLLTEEGYSVNVEKYFFDGFLFCGSLPVFVFLKRLNGEDRLDFIIKITKGEIYNNNVKNISLKILIHLLALFLVNFPQDIETIGLLIRCIPYRAKNKSGRITGDLSSIVDKYFVSELTFETKYPDLHIVVNNKDTYTEFALLFTEAIKNIEVKNKTNPVIINTVLNWLGIKQTDKCEENERARTPKEGFNIGVLAHSAEIMKNESTVMLQAVEYIENLEKELSQAKILNDDLIRKVTFAERERGILEEKYIRLKTSSEQLVSEKQKLLSELNLSEEGMLLKEREIASLKEESEKQRTIISVYSSDKQNSLNEQLNIIASKLKTHYLNYKDAIGMDMNLELGENLKNLMGDIFKTLSKAGINVVGRISNG